MVEPAEQLVDVLHTVLDCYQRLGVIANQRRGAMATLNVTLLQDLLRQEEHQVGRLADLDARRAQLLAEINAALGSQQAANVTAIAAASKEPLKTRLLTLAAQVRTAAAHWTSQTSINQRISNAANRGFDAVLRIISGAGRQAGLYRANGRHVQNAGGSGFEAMA